MIGAIILPQNIMQKSNNILIYVLREISTTLSYR